jgi:glycosyltransferase involved in cell wall biosynthesis
VRQVSGDDNLLAGFYKAAKALVYPSLYEGFGIPPLEAMSFDCPVVCSNVSSIPEVVGDAGLMFDPYDIQSIKSALEKIVIDETLREDLINRGRARIKKFSWERCARETLDVYQKILA